MDLFSRRKMKRNARNAYQDGGDGWTWAGWLIIAAIVATVLRNCGG